MSSSPGPEAASNQTDPPAATDPADKYGRRLLRVCGIAAAMGVLVGIVFSITMWSEAESKREIKAVVFAPVSGGMMGGLLAALIGCVIAPRTFYQSPLGQDAMKLIGTKNILAARAACFIAGLLLAGLLGVISWVILGQL